MSSLLAIAVVVVLLVLAVAAAIRLVVRRDERAARPSTGLGDPIPGLREPVIRADDGADLFVAARG
jgi:hypothetical protein